MIQGNGYTGCVGLIVVAVGATACSTSESEDEMESDRTGPTLDASKREQDGDPGDGAATPDAGPVAAESDDREGSEGCYLVEAHVCDCDVGEDACEAIAGIWTTGCNSCQPVLVDAGVDAGGGAASVDSGLDPGDGGSPTDGGGRTPTHVDTGAGSDAEPSVDAGTGTNDIDAAMSRASVGCYMPEDYVCNCALDETLCERAAGIWTDGCESCVPTR